MACWSERPCAVVKTIDVPIPTSDATRIGALRSAGRLVAQWMRSVARGRAARMRLGSVPSAETNSAALSPREG
jgi:hypothetical protein